MIFVEEKTPQYAVPYDEFEAKALREKNPEILFAANGRMHPIIYAFDFDQFIVFDFHSSKHSARFRLEAFTSTTNAGPTSFWFELFVQSTWKNTQKRWWKNKR